ncbi:MAG: aldose 1-epimerase [Phycisphaerales bacterium]|nr:aldose 1-epimerase [Phycisphaerales bacterium]
MSDAASITLRCAKRDSTLTIEPQYGCVATSWIVDGHELLALPAPREEFLRSTRTGGVPLLYPYANRLRTDRFHVSDRDVDLSRELSLKRDGTGLPIHGLLLRWPHWQLERERDSALTATIDWAAHPWLMHAYPFAHTLQLRWELREINGNAALAITTSVHADRAQRVPIAFGWHPYFLAQSGIQARVQFPMTREVELLSTGLPSLPFALGKIEQRTDAKIGSNLDALFRLHSSPCNALLTDGDRKLSVEFGAGYNWMQAFSPLGASFIALEPMTAPTSALSDGTAMAVEPGGSFTAIFTLVDLQGG